MAVNGDSLQCNLGNPRIMVIKSWEFLIALFLTLVALTCGYQISPPTVEIHDRSLQDSLHDRYDRLAIDPKQSNSKNHLVGVIGGIGPAADVRFQEIVLEKDRRRRKENQLCCGGPPCGFLADGDYTPYLLYHNPKIPNNNLAVLNQGPTSLYALIDSAQALQHAGATEIAFCCTTAYHWKDTVEKSAGIPVLDLLEQVAIRVVDRGYARVGLLDVDGTIQSGAFQRVLEKHGIDVVLPDPNDQQEIMQAVAGIKTDGLADSYGSIEQLRMVAQRLVTDKHVPAIILGCTEIAAALDTSSEDFHVDIIDTLDVLADCIVHHEKMFSNDHILLTP